MSYDEDVLESVDSVIASLVHNFDEKPEKKDWSFLVGEDKEDTVRRCRDYCRDAYAEMSREEIRKDRYFGGVSFYNKVQRLAKRFGFSPNEVFPKRLRKDWSFLEGPDEETTISRCADHYKLFFPGYSEVDLRKNRRPKSAAFYAKVYRLADEYGFSLDDVFHVTQRNSDSV